jgi:TetR/AcrR family fatty acid metabolism transcriptional regulator
MPIIVDKQKKRQEIMEAAIAVFSKTGYHRAKIKDIADEAGVGKGTVYEYFRTKEDLFFQAGEFLFANYIESQKLSLDAVADPKEKIRTLVSTMLENAALWTGMMYLTIDMWSEMDRKGEEDKLRLVVKNMVMEMADMLSQYVREGQEQGFFKPLDPRLMSRVVLASLDGLVFQLLVNREAFDTKAMADTLTEILLEGMAT